MASTLIGGRAKDRVVDSGHGTSALGPSDTSDSASDIAGSGRDIGDADLGSDSDSVGTGEHRAAGRDPRQRADGDVLPDHIESVGDLALDEDDDEGDLKA